MNVNSMNNIRCLEYNVAYFGLKTVKTLNNIEIHANKRTQVKQ